MASADTRGWILTFIFFFAAWLLGSPNESLRQIGKRNPDLASNLEMRLVRRLPQKPGPALNALGDKTAVSLLLAWERALLHPWGGGAYVLVTLLGPTLLGVPDLVPKGWIWVILILISGASIYGVQRTGRDDSAKEERIIAGTAARIASENKFREERIRAEEQRIRAEEREISDLREIEEIGRREIEAGGGTQEGPTTFF